MNLFFSPPSIPALLEESKTITANKSAAEAALRDSDLGKREDSLLSDRGRGIRLDYIEALSDHELDLSQASR